MATELFRSERHLCVAFNDLVRGDDGVQANQFLIVDGDQSARIDPGGAPLHTPLSLALPRYVSARCRRPSSTASAISSSMIRSAASCSAATSARR